MAISSASGSSAPQESRLRIAAERLGFHPKQRAVIVSASGKELTHTVGVIVGSVSNPFYSSVTRAVEDVAAARGCAVITASLDEDGSHEAPLVLELSRRNVDGIILAPAAANQNHLAPLLESGAAFVCVDRPPHGVDIDSVLCNNAEASEAAVSHLLDHGHRRIAYLGDLNTLWTAQERERGYRVAMEKAGVAASDLTVISGLRSEIDAWEAAIDLLSQPQKPTAIFASQNLVTLGVIRALQDRALNRQIALVGFDDFAASDLIRPAITVMAQDPYRMGELAALQLFDRIHGTGVTPKNALVTAELIVRGSGELPPV